MATRPMSVFLTSSKLAGKLPCSTTFQVPPSLRTVKCSSLLSTEIEATSLTRSDSPGTRGASTPVAAGDVLLPPASQAAAPPSTATSTSATTVRLLTSGPPLAAPAQQGQRGDAQQRRHQPDVHHLDQGLHVVDVA